MTGRPAAGGMSRSMSDRDETPDVLTEARELLAGITPGQWEADGAEVSQHWSCPEPWEKVVSTDVACMSYCYGGSAQGIANAADAEFIAAAPRLVRDLLAEVEYQRADLDAAAYRAGRRQGAIGRVRELAEGWLTEPCVGGYRITNGNDDDSQCLHCAADVLLEALDGGE